MNNKGFAITTILYGVLILFCLLLVSMLGILSTYRNNLEKLIKEDNGARAIAQKDSINISTFRPSSAGVGTYLGNGIYGYSKTSQWASYCLQPVLFEGHEGERFRLSYSFQKTGGTLKNIGGHSPGAKETLFYIDGQPQERDPNATINYNLYHDVGPAADGYGPEENMADDTDVHDIVFEFTYQIASGTNGKIICVQPNRGLETTVEGKIFNLKLVNLSQ